MSNYCINCKYCYKSYCEINYLSCKNDKVVHSVVSEVTGCVVIIGINKCEVARTNCKGTYFERKVSKLDKVLKGFGEFMNAFLHW